MINIVVYADDDSKDVQDDDTHEELKNDVREKPTDVDISRGSSPRFKHDPVPS